MILLQHEKDEFSRMAQAAYAIGKNNIGHKFSVAATKNELPIEEFDILKREYCLWLGPGDWSE